MKLNLKNLIFIPMLFVLMLGVTGCNSSSKSADSVPQVAATTQDIETLSTLAGKELNLDPQSPALDDQINGASIASALTLENGRTFNFFDSVLTVQDNVVTYNAIGYPFADTFEDSGMTFYLFSKQNDEGFYSEIQISTGNNIITNLISTLTMSIDESKLSTVLTSSGRVDYLEGNDLLARFSINNMKYTLEIDLTATPSITHSDGEESTMNFTFSGTLSIPFSLTLNSITYSGEFSSVLNSNEDSEMVSPLIRDGKDIGEVRVLESDSQIRFYLRNDEGELVELTN